MPLHHRLRTLDLKERMNRNGFQGGDLISAAVQVVSRQAAGTTGAAAEKVHRIGALPVVLVLQVVRCVFCDKVALAISLQIRVVFERQSAVWRVKQTGQWAELHDE